MHELPRIFTPAFFTCNHCSFEKEKEKDLDLWGFDSSCHQIWGAGMRIIGILIIVQGLRRFCLCVMPRKIAAVMSLGIRFIIYGCMVVLWILGIQLWFLGRCIGSCILVSTFSLWVMVSVRGRCIASFLSVWILVEWDLCWEDSRLPIIRILFAFHFSCRILEKRRDPTLNSCARKYYGFGNVVA